MGHFGTQKSVITFSHCQNHTVFIGSFLSCHAHHWSYPALVYSVEGSTEASIEHKRMCKLDVKVKITAKRGQVLPDKPL